MKFLITIDTLMCMNLLFTCHDSSDIIHYNFMERYLDKITFKIIADPSLSQEDNSLLYLRTLTF